MPTFPLAHKHADLDQHNAKLLIRIAAETGDTPLTPAITLSRLGDEAQLRGIPAIGRGVQGHIAHTKPGA
jgi:hypothetical protein